MCVSRIQPATARLLVSSSMLPTPTITAVLPSIEAPTASVVLPRRTLSGHISVRPKATLRTTYTGVRTPVHVVRVGRATLDNVAAPLLWHRLQVTTTRNCPRSHAW